MNANVLTVWEEVGQMKVVLQVPNAQTLTALTDIARSKGLPHFLLTNASQTNVLLAVGPCAKEQIDSVSGSLKLY